MSGLDNNMMQDMNADYMPRGTETSNLAMS